MFKAAKGAFIRLANERHWLCAEVSGPFRGWEAAGSVPALCARAGIAVWTWGCLAKGSCALPAPGLPPDKAPVVWVHPDLAPRTWVEACPLHWH